MDDMLTPKQLAAKLQISPLTLGRWVREGSIPYYRLNGKDIRFDPEEVETWKLARYKAPANSAGPRESFQGKKKKQED